MGNNITPTFIERLLAGFGIYNKTKWNLVYDGFEDYFLKPKENAETKSNAAVDTGKDITLEKIIDLSRNQPDVLKKIFITGNLLKELDKFSYDEQVEIYQATQKILPPKSKKDFEKIIRAKRKKDAMAVNGGR